MSPSPELSQDAVGCGSPAGDRPLSKGERTRIAIIEAAIARFVSDGFQRTSIADVARDVGLSPSAVYRYFPTKEALFIAAVDEDGAGMIDLIRTATFGDGAGSIADLLARMRAELVTAVDGHPLAARALSGVEPMSPERIMALPHLAQLRHDLTERLRIGQRSGLVRQDVRADELALGIETIVLYQMAHIASLRGTDAKLDHDRWGAIAAVIDAALHPVPTP